MGFDVFTLFYFRASIFFLGDTRHRCLIIIKTLTHSLFLMAVGNKFTLSGKLHVFQLVPHLLKCFS